MRSVSSTIPIRYANATEQTAQATVRLLVLSWLLVAVSLATVGGRQIERPPGSNARLVNPNDAPWWELTVLPEIGPELARQIVDYRETCRARARASSSEVVFRSANDLDAVRGIGPKTIARLEPHLCFDNETLSQPPGAIDDYR